LVFLYSPEERVATIREKRAILNDGRSRCQTLKSSPVPGTREMVAAGLNEKKRNP